MKIKEIQVRFPLTYASSSKVSVPLDVIKNNNEEEKHNNELMIHNEHIIEEPQDIALTRSQRERRIVISNDYVVYIHELEIDLSIINDDKFRFHKSQVVIILISGWNPWNRMVFGTL